MKNRYYSAEEREFLTTHIPNRSFADTARLFNLWNTYYPEIKEQKPRPPITADHVKGFANRYKVKTGRDTKFKKGQISHNKGKYCRYSPKSEFKKGNRPYNYKPLGTISIKGDGYLWKKIADPNKWRQLHLLIWEQAHGPVPKGHIVVFGDGDKRNVTLKNLLLVTRAQLLRLNQQNLFGASVELTKIGLMVADLKNKIGEKERERKKRKRKAVKNE